MTARVIQGSFLGGQPKLPPPILAQLPPPIQAKTVARPPGPPVTAFAGRPPGPPAPAFAARPPGPLTLSLAGRPGAMQRHGAGGAFAVEAGQVGLLSGGGRPLPDAVRGKMEAALGADFSNVRVHVGPQAERIGAIAFTVGSDIYFAPGRYQPDTMHGQQLLGHELAHVVQQRSGRVKNPLGSGIAVVQDHALEAEADRLGQRAAAPVSLSGSVQRSAPRDFRVVNLPGRVRVEALGHDRLAPIGGVELRHATSGMAELCNLCVAEPHRRQHLGSALVRKAVETARSTGARSVVLEVRPGDRAIDANALVSMYQKLGFRASGRSAAGNTVMQRATGTEAPFLPSASSSKGGRSRTVQRMDANIRVGGPKPSFEDYIGWLNEQKRTREQAQSLSTRLTLARNAIAYTRGKLRHGAGNILAQSTASKQYSVKYARLAYDMRPELLDDIKSQLRIVRYSPESVFQDYMNWRDAKTRGEEASLSKETEEYITRRKLVWTLAAQSIAARKTGAGNCDHFAAVSLFYLMEHAVKGSCLIYRLSVTSSEGGHSVVVIADDDWTPDMTRSDPAYHTAVVVDAWPTNAFAVRWDDWFYKAEKPKIILVVSPGADAPDVRKKVLSSYRAVLKTDEIGTGKGSYGQLQKIKEQSLLDFSTPVSHRPDLKLPPTYQQWTDEHPLRAGHPVAPVAESNDCFITTACTAAQGLADDCAELTVLRQYRDGYLRHRPDGPALIEQYYRIAPVILTAIKAEQEAPAILAGLYDQITQCVALVVRGENEATLEAYRAMVNALGRNYLVAV